MSDDNPATLDELGRSLIKFQQLRRSALSAIVLMLIGAVIIVVSLIYTVTKGRSLESEIQGKTADLSKLQDKINTANSTLTDRTNELDDKTKELDDVTQKLESAKKALSDIKAGKGNPRLLAQQALSS